MGRWPSSVAPVEAAVVLLACLVLLRLGIAAAAAGLVRGTARASRAVRRALIALRPRLARRVVAGALGLAAPASALAHAPAAGAAARADLDPVAVAPRADAPRAARPEVYVVRRGDTLWDIARRHLPAGAGATRVAHAWPRWYAANRGVIGADPSLIVPGQRLLVPGRRSAGTPTQPHAAPAPTPGTPVPSALSLDPDRR